MSSKIVYLVSGANRGIGFGLVSTLVARANVVVFAGARDPAKATELNALAAKHPGVLFPIKLTSADEDDNAAAIAFIEKTAGQLDVVIANAGIAKYFGALQTTPVSEWKEHFDVNVVGPIVLFDKAYPLLVKSAHKIFAVIGSDAGSISGAYSIKAAAYGTSKAAVNFATVSIHLEYGKEGIVAFVIHPGWLQSDMGNGAAVANGYETAPTPISESIPGILAHIDGATLEKTGGKFLSYTGDECKW